MWHVEHKLETTASPAAIWQRWGDVQHWPEWDESLAWVRFRGVLTLGSQGAMKLRSGERLNFRVIACTPGTGFICQARTLGTVIRMVFQVKPSNFGARLTHRVEVRGVLAWLLAFTLGRHLRESLPVAARKLARLTAGAEAPSSLPLPRESRDPAPPRKGRAPKDPNGQSQRPGKAGRRDRACGLQSRPGRGRIIA